MLNARSHRTKPTLMSLEAAAESTRAGFGCMFSSSDEYESALIAQRRALGRYGAPKRRSTWPAALFIGCTLIMFGVVLALS
jgi:hypothetical protein